VSDTARERAALADHDRAVRDARYLLNAKDWDTSTPVTAAMMGNLAQAYLESSGRALRPRRGLMRFAREAS
jgi:hypothetical protein